MAVALDKLTSPRPCQVFQRNDDYLGDIPVSGVIDGGPDALVQYRLTDGAWQKADVAGGCFTGIVKDVPVGGPYTLEVRVNGKNTRRIPGLLVGDLWILAGQSNMDGCAKLVNVEPPNRMVHALYYNETWGIAKDPLCIVVDSIDPVHWPTQDAVELEKHRQWDHDFREIGASLGIRFGKDLYKATGVPVGLLVCSHGGTSLGQWSPKLKFEGGRSLYGSMLRRVNESEGKVAGCLWYQGESDALGPTQGTQYKDDFRFLIDSMRADLNNPDMPFIYVQLAPFFSDDAASRDGWNRVQQAQLTIEKEMPGLAMVAAIDSTISDIIHADAVSLRRIGARMAIMARRLRFGEDIPLGPRPAEIGFADGVRTVIRIKYAEVNGKLTSASGIRGFLVEKDGVPCAIKGCKADGDSVLITLAEPAPNGALLWYGRGINPTVSLKDSAGFAAPVFGPEVL